MEKMEEYRNSGARLGWLLDPVRKQVLAYRPGQPAEILDQPSQISGEAVLKGFVLEVPQIWAAMERANAASRDQS